MANTNGMGGSLDTFAVSMGSLKVKLMVALVSTFTAPSAGLVLTTVIWASAKCTNTIVKIIAMKRNFMEPSYSFYGTLLLSKPNPH